LADFQKVLIFYADKLMMGNSKNSRVFNSAILKSRKFDAHKIYVF